MNKHSESCQKQQIGRSSKSLLTEGCKNGPADSLNNEKKQTSITTDKVDMNFSLVGDPNGGNKL